MGVADVGVSVVAAARTAVWNASERRPRAAVRLALHLLVVAAWLIVLDLAGAVLPPLATGPLAFAGLLAITWAAARGLDRRPFVDLGLRVDGARALDLAAGAVVGAGCIALVMGLEVASGACDYAAAPIEAGRLVQVAFVAVFFVGVAIQEELVFRGYHLVNFTEGLAGRHLSPPAAAALATFLASLGFGLAHAGNDGASLVATLQVAVAGGTLLAVGFVLTGDLAFSIGLHFAWNFTQAAFGMPVSGFVLAQAALLTRTPHGGELLTGGAFGPEASLLGLTGMLVGTAASLAYVRARYGPLRPRLRLTPPAAPSSEPPSGDR